MRRSVRILGIVLVGALVVGAGWASAQDKPAGDKDKKETVAAADPISGDWEGSVDTPNGTINFKLTIKVDKDKVSGEIGSSEGSSPLTGTWTDSKLTASFDYNGTPVVMTGGVKDAALTGEMNYGGGQSVMNYTAKRPAAK